MRISSTVHGHSRLGASCLALLGLLRLIPLMAIAAAGTALAGELTVSAPVVDVEPVRAPPTSVEYCDDKPAGASLAQTLAWDLGLKCRTEFIESAEVTGYRVFYRWDDRVYSQVMAAAPGATIPLSVKLD